MVKECIFMFLEGTKICAGQHTRLAFFIYLWILKRAVNNDFSATGFLPESIQTTSEALVSAQDMTHFGSIFSRSMLRIPFMSWSVVEISCIVTGMHHVPLFACQ